MTKLLHVLTVLLLAFSLYGCSNMYECEHFRDYLNHEAQGAVVNKYLDSANHMWPTIVYKTFDGKKGVDNITAKYIPAAFDTLEVGDIFSKSSGTTLVTVTKKGHKISWIPRRKRERYGVRSKRM